MTPRIESKSNELVSISHEQTGCNFRALKTSGFNIEDTHLTEIQRIEKLFTMVMVAFTWAYLVKKHGNKAQSLVKYGLIILKQYS